MSKKVSGWPLIAPAELPKELPEITNSDEGKVLTVVDNSGTLEAEWETASGGVSSFFDLLPLKVHTISEGLFGVLKSEFNAIIEQAPVMLVFHPDGDMPNGMTILEVCTTFFKINDEFDAMYIAYTVEDEERYIITTTKSSGEDVSIYISIENSTLTLTEDVDHPTYYTGTWAQTQ